MTKKAAKLKAEKTQQPKKLSKVRRAHLAVKHGGSLKDYCEMCGARIVTMIFKGSDVCGEQCRKDRDNDHEPSRGMVP